VPIDPTLKSVLETLEDIGKQLEARNEEPSTAKAPGDDVTSEQLSKRLMTPSDQYEIRAKLKSKSNAELATMFSLQARKSEAGIPFDVWANAGGYQVQAALGQDAQLTKALDTGGATALIRQDLEPILYELYVREFPAWERFAKEPANGLVHAYNQITDFGDAQFMTELGTVTDDESTYERKTTNVSVIATRRGTSLKSQFAVRAGGMSWSPEQLELQGGLRAIAHRMQKTIFQGQATNSGGTSGSELGGYDANSFDGLRSILNTARVKNVDPAATAPGNNIRAAIDRASEEVMNQGGSVGIAYLRPTEKVTFDLQQDENVRYMNQFVNVAPGVLTNAVNTVFGPLPLASIPGDSIGNYTTTSTDGDFDGGENVADIYLLDESTISLPYLGSEGVTVLDIPIGISGQLTHLFIMFGMWGLAVKAIPFSNKVRVQLP
jgi:hypothetical protein